MPTSVSLSSLNLPSVAPHGRLSDDRLVALARAGDDPAFAAIVERYRPQLLVFARRTGANGRAEDVVQQTFLQAFAALRAGTEVSHLRGWLHQIARNAASASSRGSSEPTLDVDAVAAAAVDNTDARLLAVSALEAVADLPERQRYAFVRTALQGRSRAEVADAMGLSEGAVRQLVRRARIRVRSAVAVLTPYPLGGWLNALRNLAGSGRPAEIAAAGGAANAAGSAFKVASVIASGALAAGVISTATDGFHHKHGAGRRSAPAQARATPLVAAAVAQSRRPRAVAATGTRKVPSIVLTAAPSVPSPRLRAPVRGRRHPHHPVGGSTVGIPIAALPRPFRSPSSGSHQDIAGPTMTDGASGGGGGSGAPGDRGDGTQGGGSGSAHGAGGGPNGPSQPGRGPGDGGQGHDGGSANGATAAPAGAGSANDGAGSPRGSGSNNLAGGDNSGEASAATAGGDASGNPGVATAADAGNQGGGGAPVGSAGDPSSTDGSPRSGGGGGSAPQSKDSQDGGGPTAPPSGAQPAGDSGASNGGSGGSGSSGN